MSQNRVAMRKIREILRLAWSCKQTKQSISDSCGIGKTTVTDTLYRASAAGLSYPLPADLDDERLERLLYPQHPRTITSKRTLPDWSSLHNELLSHKNLTLMLLWQEYKEREPSGYQYSQFCDLFRFWRGKLDLSMRQEHRAGEKMFVDYCGQTTLYQRLPRLLQDICVARHDGRYQKLMAQVTKCEVLVLDDLLISSLSQDDQRELLEIIEERYDRKSTIVTSQLPIKAWHDAMRDPTLADAILDRLVHNVYKVELKGESMRKKRTDLDRKTEPA